jgi:hypothetical protein
MAHGEPQGSTISRPAEARLQHVGDGTSDDVLALKAVSALPPARDVPEVRMSPVPASPPDEQHDSAAHASVLQRLTETLSRLPMRFVAIAAVLLLAL